MRIKHEKDEKPVEKGGHRNFLKECLFEKEVYYTPIILYYDKESIRSFRNAIINDSLLSH